MKEIRRIPWVVVAVAAIALVGAGQAAAATEPTISGAASNAASLSGVTSVAVSGGFAYSPAYWSGQLNVIDISNPSAPKVVASTPSSAAMTAATNVTIAGHYAFVTAKNRNASTSSNDDGSGNSLTIVDISNPLAPTIVGMVHDSNRLFGAYSVAVSGSFAFVASQGLLAGQPATPDTSTGSFSVIDITNPGSPTIVANIDNSSLTGSLAGGLHHATSVAVSGNYAFVTAWAGSRLTAINISTPTAPVVTSSIEDSTNLALPNDVAIQGNNAYVVNQVSSGMQLAVLNISNPAAPSVVGTLTDNALLSGSYRIRLAGGFAYISGNGAQTVAAVDISDPTHPRVAGSITSSRLANVDGISTTQAGRYVLATAPDLGSESPPLYPPYPLQAGGPTNTGTVAMIDLEPSPLSVSIAKSSEPANPTTQSSASFTFAPSDAVTHMQCSFDSAPLSPCASATSASYSSLAVGAHHFVVQATDATGATAQASYAWSVVKQSAPRSTGAPKVSGTAQQGRKLSTSSGTWSGLPAPKFRYQWLRCNGRGKSCKPIAKQTGKSYRLTAADVGNRIEVSVKAANSVGSSSRASNDTRSVRWSSATFAIAKLLGSRTRHPSVTLTLPSPGAKLKLKQIVIGLPSGISPVALRRLVKVTSVRDLHGKKVSFTARRSRGKLTLSFKKRPTGLKLRIPSGFVTISGTLQLRIQAHKVSEKVALTLSYVGKPVRKGTVKLRLA